jgi:hypothetical protein
MHISATPPSHISDSAIASLKALQRLSICLAGCSTTDTDTLASARAYLRSVFSGLPSPCLIKSFSLRVDDLRERDPGTDNYESTYQGLLSCIYKGQLICPKNWPLLTSSHVLVNVTSNNFTESFSLDEEQTDGSKLRITSHLQVNVPKADDFSDPVTPQLG